MSALTTARRDQCHDCALARICLPAVLDSEQTLQLEAITRVKLRVRRNEQIYRTGTAFQALYVVRSGGVKVVATTPDGEEQIVSFALPGELFGFDAIGSGVHPCSAVALETTSVCQVPFGLLMDLARSEPRLHALLFDMLGRSLREDQRLVTMLARRTAEQRVAAMLFGIAVRQLQRGLSCLRFRLPMSRKDIANHIGLAIETVSRVFARLEDGAVVHAKGREIRILDPMRLHALTALDAPLLLPVQGNERAPGERRPERVVPSIPIRDGTLPIRPAARVDHVYAVDQDFAHVADDASRVLECVRD